MGKSPILVRSEEWSLILVSTRGDVIGVVGDVCDRVVMTAHEVRVLEEVGAVGHVERARGLMGLVELPLCILDG